MRNTIRINGKTYRAVSNRSNRRPMKESLDGSFTDIAKSNPSMMNSPLESGKELTVFVDKNVVAIGPSRRAQIFVMEVDPRGGAIYLNNCFDGDRSPSNLKPYSYELNVSNARSKANTIWSRVSSVVDLDDMRGTIKELRPLLRAIVKKYRGENTLSDRLY